MRLPEVALDDDGRLAADIRCRSCGYNLLGLDPDATCPECAAPIARSARGDLLRFCDPAWLDRVARGLQLVFLGYLATALLNLSMPLAVGVMFGIGAASLNTLVAIAALLQTGLAIFIVLGVWLSTSPEPGKLESEPPLSARRLARWGFIAQVIFAPLQYSSPTSGMSFGQPLSSWDTFVMTLVMLLGVAVTVGVLAGLVYLRRLAHRMPQLGLASQTTVVVWGLGATIGLCLLVGGAFIFATPQFVGAGGAMPASMTPGLLVITAGGCLVALGLMSFGIAAIVIIALYRGAILKAASQSRATWIQP